MKYVMFMARKAQYPKDRLFHKLIYKVHVIPIKFNLIPRRPE